MTHTLPPDAESESSEISAELDDAIERMLDLKIGIVAPGRRRKRHAAVRAAVRAQLVAQLLARLAKPQEEP